MEFEEMANEGKIAAEIAEPKPFTKGWKGGPGRGKKGPPAPRVEAGFDRLAAMRHVLVNDAKTDATEGERACREWLKKNPGQFMETLDRLEQEAKKASQGPAQEKPADRTGQDDALDELIAEVLARASREAAAGPGTPGPPRS